MDLLAELVFILSIAPPRMLDFLLPAKSKARKLYDAIVKGEIKDDDEAAQLIYKSSAKAKKYLMLKRHLIHKLSDMVLIGELAAELENNAWAEKIYMEQQLTLAEKMLAQNVYHNAEKIILKTYQRAIQFCLSSIQLKSLKLLRLIYSLKGYPEETLQYQKLYLDCLILCEQEEQALAYWEIIQSKIKFFISPNLQVATESLEFAEIIAQQEISNNPFAKLIYYRLKIVAYSQKKDIVAWHEQLLAWDNLFEENPFLKDNHILLAWHLAWAVYYRHNKNLNEAIEHIEKALKYADYRAFNKFEVQNWHFDLLLKCNKYQKALEVLVEVHQTPQYDFLDKPDQAGWLIREAYLYFLLGKKAKKELPNFNKKKFWNEFLSQTQAISKDKQGFNVLFMVIRFLLLMVKEPHQNEDLGNNLRVYYQRYLKDAPPRTRFFFKNIADVARSGLKPESVEQQTLKFNQYLNQECPLYDDCELVAYEDLWLAFLKNYESLAEEE